MMSCEGQFRSVDARLLVRAYRHDGKSIVGLILDRKATARYLKAEIRQKGKTQRSNFLVNTKRRSHDADLGIT